MARSPRDGARRRPTRSPIAVFMAVVFGLAPMASATAAPRADLSVTKGSVTADRDGLTGSFVVKNGGRRAASATSAALSVKVDGKRRTLGTFSIARLSPAASKTVKVSLSEPDDLPEGTLALRACADTAGQLRETTESNNCRQVGTFVAQPSDPAPPSTSPAQAPSSSAPTPSTPPTEPTPPPSTPAPTPPPAPSTVPTTPLTTAPDANGVYTVTAPTISYRARPMSGYDATGQTPSTLLVGMHGCGDTAANFMLWAVAPSAIRTAAGQNYVAVSLGGRDGTCWNAGADQQLVSAAIADAKTHFNINPRRVVLIGYSSGGDLAYQFAFNNSGAIAGLLAMPSAPFGGGSQATSLAAATTKFPIVHIAHIGDTSYPLATVRSQLQTLSDAGFSVTKTEVAGTHDGTTADAVALIGHLNDGWLAPTG